MRAIGLSRFIENKAKSASPVGAGVGAYAELGNIHLHGYTDHLFVFSFVLCHIFPTHYIKHSPFQLYNPYLSIYLLKALILQLLLLS